MRFPLLDRQGEALVVWTTTPWTLPANVAAAIKPDAEYGRLENGHWVAVARDRARHVRRAEAGRRARRLALPRPFDEIGPGGSVEHRVIGWDEVSLDEGTGIVHIAPGAGSEDFELSRVHDLPVLTPVDESGRFYPDYGWLHGLSTVESADQIVGDLEERDLLVEAGTITHRYAECWRCHTPVIFRISDDWFITVEELRPRLLAANADVAWTPAYMGKRMDDWLRNMGDWNISRRRYYGLPLPIYPCACGHVTVIGSRAELEERALGGLDQLEELRRPWIDEVPIRCEACSEEVRRIPEVGDVWLDAGIVPFSTLGWQNDEWVEEGYATGAAKGLTTADLPDHAYWEQWFPADWVSEMREQIRLWFYSQLFMSVVLTGQAPFRQVLGYEKMLDESGREMHGSWGNMIDAEDAFARMGADVMRWQFSAQPPNQNLLFGFGPAGEIKRKLLTLWHSAGFLATYADVAGWSPAWSDLEGPVRGDAPLDRWLAERTAALAEEAAAGYDAFLTVDVIAAFDSFVDDLSNWYIRRSRRRFWDGDEAALAALWRAVVHGLRVIAPIMPFLAEHLWQALVRSAEGAPDSVHLAGWPDVPPADRTLLAEVAEVRRVVELGRRARSAAGIANRQPLGRLAVFGAPLAAAHADEIAEELRVEDVRFEATDAAARVRYKPNLPVLGPRLGKQLPAIRTALEQGDYELDGDTVVVAGERLSGDDLLRERTPVNEGWIVAAEGEASVELDPTLDDDLRTKGRVYELIHAVNSMRRDQGLELTDRIRLTVSAADADLVGPHAEWIKQETLAVAVEADGAGGLAIAKA